MSRRQQRAMFAKMHSPRASPMKPQIIKIGNKEFKPLPKPKKYFIFEAEIAKGSYNKNYDLLYEGPESKAREAADYVAGNDFDYNSDEDDDEDDEAYFDVDKKFEIESRVDLSNLEGETNNRKYAILDKLEKQKVVRYK